MVGILLKTGGAFSNAATITGQYYGVEIYGGTGTVSNAGSISATAFSYRNSFGILLKDGGSVTNYGGGSISGATAISMLDGGTVTNAAGATIAGFFGSAVAVKGAAGTISNSGEIESQTVYSGGSDIYLGAGGSVTNTLTGKISAGFYQTGISNYGSGGRVTNAGTIDGGSVQAVEMGDDGIVTNTGALGGGVSMEDGGSLTNSGSIFGYEFPQDAGGGFNGVTLGAGATVVNQAGGVIAGFNGEPGAYGIFIKGGGSIENAGKISGNKGAIRFKGLGANTLTLETGSLLKGAVIGSAANGASNKLVLEGSGTANNPFYGFDKLSMVSSGKWTLGGVSTIGVTKLSASELVITGELTTALKETASSVVKIREGGELKLVDDSKLTGGVAADEGAATRTGAVARGNAILSNMATATRDISGGVTPGTSAASSILNAGLIENAGVGVGVISAALANDGAVLAPSGALDFAGAVSGVGSDTVSGAATLEFDQSVASGQTIDFTGVGGALDLGSPTSFSGVLSGYGAGDVVSLAGAWSITGFSQNGASEATLTLSNFSRLASLTFDGSYSQSLFQTSMASGRTTIAYE